MAINNLTVASGQKNASVHLNLISQDATNSTDHIHGQYLCAVQGQSPSRIDFIDFSLVVNAETVLKNTCCARLSPGDATESAQYYDIMYAPQNLVIDYAVRDRFTLENSIGRQLTIANIRFQLTTSGDHDISKYRIFLERDFSMMDGTTYSATVQADLVAGEYSINDDFSSIYDDVWEFLSYKVTVLQSEHPGYYERRAWRVEQFSVRFL